MNQGDTTARINGSAVVLRFAVLVVLILVAFSVESSLIFARAAAWTEWSHLFAWPVVGAFFLLNRGRDIRKRMTQGTILGLFLVALGAFMRIGSEATMQFGIIRVYGILVCMIGALILLAGFRAIIPCGGMILITLVCMPVSERTMERGSLQLQRVSLDCANATLKLVPGVDCEVRGKVIHYETNETVGDAGMAEQRFGVRYLPACLMIGLFAVFAKKRRFWQIGLLAIASLPILFICNIMRLDAWVVTAAYGGFDAVSAVPRNMSIIVTLVTSFLLFVLAARVLSMFESLIDALFAESDEQPEVES